MKLTKDNSELHPEGMFLFKVVDSGESKGKFGIQVKWTLESTERDSEGARFRPSYYTGSKISGHPECKIYRLIEVCGFDPVQFEDTEELHGAVFCGKVEHNEEGTYANIVKVLPPDKLKKAPKEAAEGRKKPAAKADTSYVDPFEEE